MGIHISKQAKTTLFHRKRKLQSKHQSTNSRDEVTQVGAIDFLEEEVSVAGDRRLLPLLHSVVASSTTIPSSAKEKWPLSIASQRINFQHGDVATEPEIQTFQPIGFNLKGDSVAQNFSLIPSFGEKTIQPITYHIRLSLLEGPLTRLLFVDLYGLDMLQLRPHEFTHWAELAGLVKTATMYDQFRHDANNYAIRQRLTALEQRFNVRCTLGDFESLPETIKPQVGPISPPDGVRELTIYGESACKIASAANYFGAVLNQIMSDQLLLPNSHVFLIGAESELMQWIAPIALDVAEPILVRLRRSMNQVDRLQQHQ